MIQVRRVFLGLALAALPLVAGCSSTSTPPPPPAASFVYYGTDFGAPVGSPEMGIVSYPITATSVLGTTLDSSVGNGLNATQNLAFDGAGHLFVVNAGPAPENVLVFTPPLTATSTPIAVLTLPAALTFAFGIAFDSAGNMWIGDFNLDNIYEFTPTTPFTTTQTLVAAITMVSKPGPCGLAFDSSGNLWEGLDTTPNGINEFVKGAGFTNATVATVALDGLADPCGIAFDHNGNLYAGGDPPKGPKSLALRRMSARPVSNVVHPNVVEADGIGFWPAANLVNGGLPTIVNATGLATGFFSEQLTIDAAGNLYDADCGTTAKIYVYPTATSAWSTSLAPVTYSDANIVASGCVEGIAIH
jgi:hypothetical protein